MSRTQHADVQAVVDRLAAAVGQSVLVEDLDQHPVWWSTHGDVDPTRRRTILDRRVDPSAAAVVDRFKLRQATAPVRTPAIPEADMWARWCVPARFGDRLLGLLWVLDPDEAIGDDALPALLECAAVAARAMAGDERADEHRRQVRAELVDRRLAGPDEDAGRELARLERVPPTALVQVEGPAAGRSRAT
jgi:hypothetical protein